MKKILFCIFAIILASGCSLKEHSFTEIEKDAYFKDAQQAQTVLFGLYRDLTPDAMYGYHLSLYFTLGTDEAKVTGNTIENYRNVPSNAYTSTEDEVQNTWKALYSAIYDANDFIERLSVAVNDFSASEKNLAAVYMAEARTLRALFYFELVRWWKNVSLITSTADSKKHPSTFVQTDPAEVYAFIENELKYAISVLPYASDDPYRASNDFRISKGGAMGLLAKVYATWAGYPMLNTAKWEECAKVCKTLVESGKHSLLDNYEDLWKNSGSSTWDPRESLIEVSFYSAAITGNSSTDCSGRIGKWNGASIAEGAWPSGRAAANWIVLPSFAKNWTDYNNDKRWALSMADYKYTVVNGQMVKDQLLKVTENGTQRPGYLTEALPDGVSASFRKPFNNGITPAKWDIVKYETQANAVTDANLSNFNWYILRYADVLLLYAEALNEWQQGPTPDAFAAVNMVRRRGYGLPVNTASSLCDLDNSLAYEDFRQAVRDERAHELCFEGHRRQDLIRWGIYYETIRGAYQDLVNWHENAPDYYRIVDYTIKGKNELLPIPQREMDLMEQYRQNPNW